MIYDITILPLLEIRHTLRLSRSWAQLQAMSAYGISVWTVMAFSSSLSSLVLLVVKSESIEILALCRL